MKKHIILASNSPRRRELLAGLDLDFEVKVLPNVAEDYPHDLPAVDVAGYIAREKADVYKAMITEEDLVITADTVVANDARRMLHLISGRKHQVVTGVCLLTSTGYHSFSVTTDVTFKQLSDEEINYYIEHFKPFDKAGAYGIQEWIGYVGVTSINGSYFNVMGLPVQRIWEEVHKL